MPKFPIIDTTDRSGDRILYWDDAASIHKYKDEAGAAGASPIEQVKMARANGGTVVNPEVGSETAVPDLSTISITTTGSRSIRVTYTADIVKGTDSHKVKYYVYRDGAKVSGNPSNGWYSRSVGESNRQQVSFTFIEKGLAAGTYVYAIRRAAGVGTSSTTYQEQVLTVEVINETT